MNARRPQRIARIRIVALAAVIVSIVVASITMVAAPRPAQAAPAGPGLQFRNVHGKLDHLGPLWLDGKLVYCAQAASGSGMDVPDDTPRQGSTDLGLAPDTAARVNWLISTVGQTDNPLAAYTVQLVVWSLLDQLITEARTFGYRGTDNRGAAEQITRRLNPALIPDILALYDRLHAEARAIVANASPGSATISVRRDATNPLSGAIRVTVTPATAIGDIRLTNAVFADTGTAQKSGVGGGEYAVRVVVPAHGKPFRVTASGVFAGTAGWAPQVAWYPNHVQNLIGPGERGSSSFSAEGVDPDDRQAPFRPIVQSRVASSIVTPGTQFTDTLRFDVVADAAGITYPWARTPDGSYRAVTAIGTLYGPSPTPFPLADEPPAGTPVAQTGVRVTTSATDGPTVTYRATAPEPSTAAGYYTWMWRIDAANQPDDTRAALPTGYRYADRFGQIEETATVPMRLDLSTAVTRPQVQPTQSVIDEIRVRVNDGGWLRVDGAPATVTLVASAYFTPTRPVPQDVAPVDAKRVGEPIRVTLTGEGTGAAGVPAPDTEGFVTFQWCVEAQPGVVVASCDRWGLPEETVQIVAAPTVPVVAAPAVATPLAIAGTRIGIGPPLIALSAISGGVCLLALATYRRRRDALSTLAARD